MGPPLVQMMLLLYMLTPNISNDFRMCRTSINVGGSSSLGSFPSCAKPGPWGRTHYFVFHWVEAAQKHSKCAKHKDYTWKKMGFLFLDDKEALTSPQKKKKQKKPCLALAAIHFKIQMVLKIFFIPSIWISPRIKLLHCWLQWLD